MSFDAGPTFAPAPMPSRPQPRMVPQGYVQAAPSRPRPIPLPRNVAVAETPRRAPERKPEPPPFVPLEVRTPEAVGVELVTAEVLPIPEPAELGIRLD